MSAREVTEAIRARQSSIWVDGYRELYAAFVAASELLNELATARFEIASFDEGLEWYCKHWFRIDQLYRQFHFAARMSEHAAPLEALRKEVDKQYTNRYLYELGNSWQQQVDAVQDWRSVTLRVAVTTPLVDAKRSSIPQKQPPAKSAERVGTNASDSELTQCLVFFGVSLSPSKTCPRCPAQFEQTISVRRPSGSIRRKTASGRFSSNAGQPQEHVNLSDER